MHGIAVVMSGWRARLGRGSFSSMSATPNPYHSFRFPAEVIQHAVWLYHCFSLSLREVELILAARGIVVSYESIREWGLCFGRLFANALKRRRPKPGDKWFLDEVFTRIRGKLHYGGTRSTRMATCSTSWCRADVMPRRLSDSSASC
jgi:putative transposase